MKETQRDSGYAWVILLVSLIHNTIDGSVFTCLAVYMIYWIEEFNCTKAEAGLVASLFGATLYLGVLLSAPLIKKFGCKTTTILGTLICVIGLISGTFAPAVWWLYITNGLIVGIGHGLYFPPPLIIVQYYFDKNRALASGISLMGHSIGAWFIPLLQLLMDTYGWRGAMLIHAGIVMQLLIAGCLYRTPNIPELQNVESVTEEPQNNNIAKTKARKPCFAVKDFFKSHYNFSLFRNPQFVQFLVAVMLCYMAYDIMYKFSPLRAISKDVSVVNASFMPTILAIAAGMSRIITSFIANMSCVNRTILFGTAAFSQGCSAILSCFAWNFISLGVCTALFGTFVGMYQTLLITVTVHLVGIRYLSDANSFLFGSLIIPTLSAMSLAGLMADKTNNYDLPYLIYGILQLIGGILLFSILVTQKYCMKTTKYHNGTLKDSDNNKTDLEKMKEECMNASMQSLCAQ